MRFEMWPVVSVLWTLGWWPCFAGLSFLLYKMVSIRTTTSALTFYFSQHLGGDPLQGNLRKDLSSLTHKQGSDMPRGEA